MILQKIGLCRISRSFIFSKLQDEHGNVLNHHTQRECAGMLMRILGARFDVVIIFQSLQLIRIFSTGTKTSTEFTALAEKNLTRHSRLQQSLHYHTTSPLDQRFSANSKIRSRTACIQCKSYLGAFPGASKQAARKQHNCRQQGRAGAGKGLKRPH